MRLSVGHDYDSSLFVGLEEGAESWVNVGVDVEAGLVSALHMMQATYSTVRYGLSGRLVYDAHVHSQRALDESEWNAWAWCAFPDVKASFFCHVSFLLSFCYGYVVKVGLWCSA